MSPPPGTVGAATPNSKRYWGEEKNIDSIYSIYLKKISYTFNNDISISATHANQYQANGRDYYQDDAQSTNSSNSNELARFALHNSNSILCNKSFKNDSFNCQKKEETPRSRRNFFQKYRRRSCSMDKYSSEKQQQQLIRQQQQQKSSTPLSKSRDMKFTPPRHKDATNGPTAASDELSFSHDDLDGCLTNKKGSLASSNGRTNYKLKSNELHMSASELSSQSSQSLQWETRLIKVLQAATLDHALKFILLINTSKDLNDIDQSVDSSLSTDEATLEEERNNVAHIIHVLFCTYRTYTNPYELMLKLMDYSDICRVEQYRFVMHYWMDNYPEDFDYVVNSNQNGGSKDSANTTAPSLASLNNSIASCDSCPTSRTAPTSYSDSNSTCQLRSGPQSENSNLDRRLSNLSLKSGNENRRIVTLASELLRLCHDDYVRDKAIKMIDMKAHLSSETNENTIRRHRQGSSRNSAVLDLDSRYVAQQLTAIDLENFLNLKPYSLLEGTKSDRYIKNMVKNFNLLSRHVVVTILKSHQPHIVASHWIAIAMNLRKIKNFNSLKAIIAGLTNESVYRLKQSIWSKIDKTNMANFKQMAVIVDDVNNQTVLRQTQLVVEGTAKMSFEDDSFGTIPYLGTFLTDLNMIDARYQSYVPSPKDETSKLKLINFEKCAKQFEILTQVQLLQKNVLASLHAILRRNNFDGQTTMNRSKLQLNQNHQILLARPAIPQVSRLFENWFYDDNVTAMTDKQCYETSVSLEPNTIQR